MKKYKCNDCYANSQCELSTPDDLMMPSYCPANDGNNEFATWVEIVEGGDTKKED